ncbi:MAG TPA: hypothetical protein ENO24_01645 [Chloroflexi bacterium]|nr:hypothetical protein [Chloroflexota bacterium]
MRTRRLPTIVILIVAAACTLACAVPLPVVPASSPPPTPTSAPTATPTRSTPTPEAREPNYSNTSLGLSLWYPETWVYQDMPDAVAFASSPQLMSSEDWDTGAAFAVMRAELEDGQSIKDLIREQLEASAFTELETTELQPSAIGDARGIITSLEASPPRASMIIKGFVAGVERNRQAYLFLGLSDKDDWPEFGDALEAMLHSVRFTEPVGTFTSEDLGLKIWYAEDWIVEEDRDQVLFATSADLIENEDLASGAALMVRVSSMPDVLLADWLKEELESLTFDAGGLTSDVAPRTVGGREGLIIDLEGVPSGTGSPVAGFVAGASFEGQAYLFLAVAAKQDWADYASTLEKMLDSVEFME